MKNKGKQQRSRVTIRVILDAAAHVLVSHGYEKATTNRIADKAGYSVGTLYQYFENKEDIFEQLIEQEVSKLIATFQNTETDLSLRNTLSCYNQHLHSIFRNDPMLFSALVILLTGRFRAHRDNGVEIVITSMIALLEDHRREITEPDLALAARVIVSATEGFATGASADFFLSKSFLPQLLKLQLAYLTTNLVIENQGVMGIE